jgi:CheY-like chemotaxis protein
MALFNVDSHTASRRRFILVADSRPAGLSYTSTLLKRFEYNVCPARTAGEALETASIITPILVITAQNLDDMPVRELIGKLKQIDSTRAVSTIVLTTRKADPENERACLCAGAVTCLPAHTPVEDLYRVIQMAVEPVPRMNLRINTKLPVTINNNAVDCDEGGCAQALSENGAYIRTSKPYPLKTRLPVQIHLADTRLSVEAEVIYTRKPGNEPKPQVGMGLQFVHISLGDQLRIRKFIRDEITRGIR